MILVQFLSSLADGSHYVPPEQRVFHFKANKRKSPHTCFTLLMKVWPLRMIHNTAYESLSACACICACVCVCTHMHAHTCNMFSFSSSIKKGWHRKCWHQTLTAAVGEAQWTTAVTVCGATWNGVRRCSAEDELLTMLGRSTRRGNELSCNMECAFTSALTIWSQSMCGCVLVLFVAKW